MKFSRTGKTLSIDFSPDRLLDIASRHLDAHNYLDALRMLNKNAELNGNDAEAYMTYAEIFDDMGLYERSVNFWFRYIDCAEDGADFADAYEGLAVDFLNMGEKGFAAFYYNKLLLETDAELTDADRREIIESFLLTEKPSLKVAYPPALADYTAEMERGVELMRGGDFEGAVAEFSKVGEGNEKFAAARNYIAMCFVICDRLDEAEAECLKSLERNPEDIQAISILAAVKTQQKKFSESRALAEKLMSLEVKDPDEIYRIATVACENGMHGEAYSLFEKLEGDLGYDLSVLYFKAVAAYNSGRTEESLKVFDKLLVIYPESVTARYTRQIVRNSIDGGNGGDIPYFYRLPQTERESNLKILAAFHSLNKAEAAKLCENIDITDNILWCFDEREGNGSAELQYLGASCAVKAELDGLLRDILLDAELPDGLKIETVSEIACRNNGGTYGVVLCNIYRRVQLIKLEIPAAKRKKFIKAYAALVSRFGIVGDDYVEKLHDAAEKLYYDLAEKGKLSAAEDFPALTAAILYLSGIKEAGATLEEICAFLGADKDKTQSVLD